MAGEVTLVPDAKVSIQGESDRGVGVSANETSCLVPTTEAMEELARFVYRRFNENKEHRMNSGIDARLLRNLYMAKHQYDDTEKAQIMAQGLNPDLFTPLVATKIRAALSQLMEIFNSPGDQPWTLRPTPLPSVPPSVTKKIMTQVAEDCIRIFQVTGLPLTPQASYDYAMKRMDDAYNSSNQYAKECVARMEIKVHDQLVEGFWLEAFNDYANYIAYYGTAVIKGPIVRTVERTICKENELGVRKYSTKPVQIPCVEAVNPWDCFPSKGAKRIDEGYFCQRVTFTSDELSMCAAGSTEISSVRDDGEWYQDTIAALLDKFPNGGITLDAGPNDLVRRKLENDGVDPDNSCQLEGIEMFGKLPGRELFAFGIKKTASGKRIEEDEFYESDIITIDNYVIYCKITEASLGRPLSKGIFFDTVDSWWGDCIADKLVTTQRLCNATMRNLVTNQAATSGPMMLINDIGRMTDQSPEALRMKPWGVIVAKNSLSGANTRLIELLQADSRISELTQTFDYWKKQADEDCGIPAYTYGTNVAGGAGRTASGLAMLTEAASRGMKMVITTTDRDVIRPMIKRLVQFNMLYDPDLSIKGDCEVNPAGIMGMILKEQESMRRKQMLGLITGNPLIYPLVGPKGIAALLREEFKSLGVNPDDILASKAQMEEIELLDKIQRLNQANGDQSQQPQQDGQPQQIESGAQRVEQEIRQEPREFAAGGAGQSVERGGAG